MRADTFACFNINIKFKFKKVINSNIYKAKNKWHTKKILLKQTLFKLILNLIFS